jgi:hypothetical protein
MERSVVRDEEALCECLLLTSTTLVHGMKGLGAAFTAAIAAMRTELGFVPPGQHRIILDQLTATRNDVRPASRGSERLHHPKSERRIAFSVLAYTTLSESTLTLAEAMDRPTPAHRP